MQQRSSGWRALLASMSRLTATTCHWRRPRRRRLPLSISCRVTRPSIVALLRQAEDGWSAEDRQVLFDERAGIIEFDGGAPRAWAEALAQLDPASPPCDIPPNGGCASLTTADVSSTTAGPHARLSGWGPSICLAATGSGRLPASISWDCFGC